MPTFPVDWVDAFTDRPFGGNPCAVVHDADDISDDDRMALVRETSLTECAFVVDSREADFGARYYLATREIPMAGHPTVATIASLVHRGAIDLSDGEAEITLEVGSGILPIFIQKAGANIIVTMTQQAPEFGQELDPGRVARIYGLDAADVVGTPKVVSTGNPFVVTLLSDRGALDAARLNILELEQLQKELNDPLIEPFLCITEGATGAGQTFARLLLPPPLPAEDPFTGSATGAMAAWLWAEGHLKAPRFIAEQGHGLGRPGLAAVEVIGPREDIDAVKVAGPARVLMSGDLYL